MKERQPFSEKVPKRLLNCFLLLLCLGCEVPQPPAPKPQPKPINALQCLTTDIKQIAVTRPTGSEANHRVAGYIEAELKKINLTVRQQDFGSGVNIIGIQRGQIAQGLDSYLRQAGG